jgi:hypothetical protein
MRWARFYINEIRTECPWCEEVIRTGEGGHTNECDMVAEGRVRCENCHRMFYVPDASEIISRRVRPARKVRPTAPTVDRAIKRAFPWRTP